MTTHALKPNRRATVIRIIAQLKGDPRTIALILVLPALLLILLYYVFIDAPTMPGEPRLFDSLGPIMLAILPMIMLFIVTSVTMLRERTTGTLERIMTTPLTRFNLLVSYAIVFGVLAIGQAGILAAIILGPMDVSIAGPWWAFLILAFLSAVLGVSMGLLASAFARTEFQAVQFMPAFMAPQIFLCGLFIETEHMPTVLARISDWLPMTWAVDVVNDIMAHPELSADSWLRLAGMAGLIVVLLVIAASSMPRKTR